MGLFKRGQVWWMRFTYQGQQIRQSTETDDKKLAQRIYYKVLGEIAEGKWFNIPVRKTFNELMDRYMDEHSKVKKRSWGRDLISLSHLRPFFGSHTLEEITPQIISQYKGLRYAEKAKPATINRELTLAKHAFNLGMKEWEWCRENPFSKVKMEKENNLRDRWLTQEEEERLLKASPQWLREIVVFALNTGMRQGEILDLTWKDVDLFRKVVYVLQEKVGEKKTVPLTPTLFELLKAKSKVRHIGHNLVFPSENGTRISGSNLVRAFRGALKKAEIENFRFHDLRHTFASRLAQSGIDPYTIQRLLGHKDPKMVQRYAHHSVESLRNGIAVLEILNRSRIEEKLAQI